MASKDEIKQKIASLSDTFHKYNIIRVGLFGSCVHNTDNETSDIDLLVDFKKTIDLIAYADLINSLSISMNRTVDIITVSGIRPELKNKIMDEVEWIEGI
jgi:predicted nucleotidyltransferase